jgi:predicted CXXCH cytochrome family protein
MRDLLWAVILLAGCNPPTADTLRDDPPMVNATAMWSVPVDAVMPSDVMPDSTGGFTVLDGYDGRELVFDATHTLTRTVDGSGAWGRTVRMTPARDGGHWLVDPSDRVLLRIDDKGTVLEEVPSPPGPEGAKLQPVAMVDLGDSLVVSDRVGTVRWIDRKTNLVTKTATKDLDGENLGLVGDLVATADGGVLASDLLEARVHHFDREAQPVAVIGRFGGWVGTLRKPTSSAEIAPAGVIVTDSALQAIELFDSDGHPIGLVGSDGAALRPSFPVAVRAVGNGDFLVLDAGRGSDAAVIGFHVDAAELETARKESTTRWLREPLVEPAHDPSKDCIQCHAGLVNDSRQVWDKKLGHHPVNVIPDRPMPPYFQLGPKGEIQCLTCHWPHGVSTASEVAGITDPKQRAELSMHMPEGDDLFTRMSRQDSSLCGACHEDAAHEAALDRIAGSAGGSHPVGKALADALAKRTDGTNTQKTGCLGCHAVHGADPDGLPKGEDDAKLCGACHHDRTVQGPNHPTGVRPETPHTPARTSRVPTEANGSAQCRSCHNLVGGRVESLLRKPTNGGSLCMSCHTDRVAAMSRDHGTLKGKDGEVCLACHATHNAPGLHNLITLASATPPDPTGCLGCHGAGGKAAKPGIRPSVLGHPVDGKTHEGMKGELTCSTCHDAHDPDPKGKVDCGTCHADKKAAASRGGHGTAQCLDCHPMHQSKPMSTAQVNPASQRCLACHAPNATVARAPQVAAFQHPAPIFTPGGARWEPLAGLPLFGPDGKELPAGQNGDLSCQSCHLVHGPDEKVPGDNLRRPSWQPACTACHGDDALLLYRWFHRPDRRADIKVNKP